MAKNTKTPTTAQRIAKNLGVSKTRAEALITSAKRHASLTQSKKGGK